MSEQVVLALFTGFGGLLTVVGTVVTAVLSSKNVARDKRIEDLEKTVVDLRSELELERKDNIALREELRELRNQVEAKDKEVRQLNTKLLALSEQLDAKDGEVRDLKNKLAASNRRISELEAQIKKAC
ncbi:MAG: hypothetical protein VB108_01210 [Anaerolineaceae bacterium]|nr:hypothetical protein [Anaerolineaceae bacterium]